MFFVEGLVALAGTADVFAVGKDYYHYSSAEVTTCAVGDLTGLYHKTQQYVQTGDRLHTT